MIVMLIMFLVVIMLIMLVMLVIVVLIMLLMVIVFVVLFMVVMLLVIIIVIVMVVASRHDDGDDDQQEQRHVESRLMEDISAHQAGHSLTYHVCSTSVCRLSSSCGDDECFALRQFFPTLLYHASSLVADSFRLLCLTSGSKSSYSLPQEVSTIEDGGHER